MFCGRPSQGVLRGVLRRSSAGVLRGVLRRSSAGLLRGVLRSACAVPIAVFYKVWRSPLLLEGEGVLRSACAGSSRCSARSATFGTDPFVNFMRLLCSAGVLPGVLRVAVSLPKSSAVFCGCSAVFF